MGVGPLIAASGIFMLLRLGSSISYAIDLLPALLLFAVGLSMTVAPLTATVLAGADASDAGIASAINNAVARVAGLIGVSAVGVAIAGELPADTFGRNGASVTAFHHVVLICGVLVAAGGVTGLLGIVDPKRSINATHCSGGQLVGAPAPATVNPR
jgi:hypothetical protein